MSPLKKGAVGKKTSFRRDCDNPLATNFLVASGRKEDLI